MIFLGAFGNVYDQPLTRSCQKNPISIFLILLTLFYVGMVPASSTESKVIKIAIYIAKIRIPCHNGVIHFQTLHLKFRCGHL